MLQSIQLSAQPKHRHFHYSQMKPVGHRTTFQDGSYTQLMVMPDKGDTLPVTVLPDGRKRIMKIGKGTYSQKALAISKADDNVEVSDSVLTSTIICSGLPNARKK